MPPDLSRPGRGSRTTLPIVLAMAVILATGAACAGDAAAPIPDYETARPVFWKKVYPDGGETLYCGAKFGSGYNRGLNIEHVLPMSWVTHRLGCGKRKQCRENSAAFNLVEADLHNLYPARQEINDARGSRPFAEIAGEMRRFGSCDFETSDRPRQVEPRPASRGEVARAMFYMAHRYDIALRTGQLETLRRWHRADPASGEEMRRNDVIESIQGNRNPFIDDPALAESTRFRN